MRKEFLLNFARVNQGDDRKNQGKVKEKSLLKEMVRKSMRGVVWRCRIKRGNMSEMMQKIGRD